MNMHTPVQHLMSVDPISVSQTAKVSEVRQLLRTHPFHHVPVVNGSGLLVGILSSVDLATYALDAWVGDVRTVDAELDASFSLEAIMTHEPVTIRADQNVRQAAAVLADGGFHALPVVDGNGRLQGMLTSTDLLRFFATQQG